MDTNSFFEKNIFVDWLRQWSNSEEKERIIHKEFSWKNAF